jgi:hypothetical protein
MPLIEAKVFLVELRKSLTGGVWLWQQHEQHLACLPDGPAAEAATKAWFVSLRAAP